MTKFNDRNTMATYRARGIFPQRLHGEYFFYRFFFFFGIFLMPSAQCPAPVSSFVLPFRNPQSDLHNFTVFSQRLAPSAQRLKNHVHQILSCLKSLPSLPESNLCASAVRKLYSLRSSSYLLYSDSCRINTFHIIPEYCHVQA